jgi:hypothetical protein
MAEGKDTLENKDYRTRVVAESATRPTNFARFCKAGIWIAIISRI